jgi:hypothetical protein
MTTPGFTAETSLYDGSQRYRMIAQEPSRGDVVEPAGPAAYAACVAICYAFGWLAGPACFVACIPLFTAPGP